MIDRMRSWLLWSWGLLLFSGMGLLMLYWLIFFKPERCEAWMKRACHWFLRRLGVRLRIIDHGRRKSGYVYLFMANHVNLLDPFVFKAALPSSFRAVELSDHFRWPIYGWIIRRLGHIPIEREQPFRVMNSLAAATKALQDGVSLIIFPEGTRTRDGKLLPFKRGAFHLAQTAGVDIVPVVQSGGFAINNKTDNHLRPGEIKVEILPPIRYVQFAMMESRRLRDLVRKRMQEALE